MWHNTIEYPSEEVHHQHCTYEQVDLTVVNRHWMINTLDERQFNGSTKMEGKKEIDEAKTTNLICFFSFGFLTFFYSELMLTAASDILAGTTIPTTAVVISTSVSQVALKTIMPWIMHKIPHIFRVLTIVVLFSSGLVTLVCSSNVVVRLVGVLLASSGTAMSEMTFISLTAFYSKITIIAFTAGVGTSGLLGTLYYTGEKISL